MSRGLEGLPPKIGRYELKSVLGRGGMGRVVLAEDPVLKREVAIKLVEAFDIEPAELAEARYMFHREARATAALRHPGIIEVYDYSGPDAELMYLAYERIEAPTLRQVLEQRRELSVELATALGYELAVSLRHAHSHGIIHRDIKPENVFWLESGRIVLGDFGIAKVLDNKSSSNTIQFGKTNVYGSPAYMAPEQLADGAADERTDLHALGALVYEMVTGAQAFDGPDLDAILSAVTADERPRLAEKRAPRELAELVDSMLAKAPDARPQSASTVADRLRSVLDSLDVTDPRVLLRDAKDAGRAVPLIQPESDPEPTELFAEPKSAAVRTRSPAAARGSLWVTVAGRGPIVLGMLAVAVMLGAGAYLFLRLDELPSTGSIFPGPTVGTDVTRAPSIEESEDVFAQLRFESRATVLVDGKIVGTWEDNVRLALPPGPHELEVRFDDGRRASRKVVLLPGSSPVFELAP